MADVSVLVRRGKAVAEHRRQTEQCSNATFLPEKKPRCTARRRMLIEPIRAAAPIPARDRATLDGFAVQASASLAAPWNKSRVRES